MHTLIAHCSPSSSFARLLPTRLYPLWPCRVLCTFHNPFIALPRSSTALLLYYIYHPLFYNLIPTSSLLSSNLLSLLNPKGLACFGTSTSYFLLAALFPFVFPSVWAAPGYAHSVNADSFATRKEEFSFEFSSFTKDVFKCHIWIGGARKFLLLGDIKILENLCYAGADVLILVPLFSCQLC